MKVLYAVTDYPCYSETFVTEEIRQLRAEGVEVSVCNFTWAKPAQREREERILNNTKHLGVLLKAIAKAVRNRQSLLGRIETWTMVWDCIRHTPAFTFKYLFLLLSLDYKAQQVATEGKVEMVSHFLFKTTLATYFIAQQAGIPYHIRLHTKISLYPTNVLVNVLQAAETISAESRDVAVFYEAILPTHRSINVVRQSVNLPNLTSIQPKRPENAIFHIIAVGRLVEKKGFHVLVHALGLRRAEFSGKLRCTIYGEGPMRNQLTRLINHYHLTDRVTLAGKTEHSDVLTEISEADLLVAPSISLTHDIDGIPTVLAEAMLLKTPVLTTAVGGILELITDGETGFIVNANDAEALADRLLSLQDVALRNRIIPAAFQKASHEYTHTFATEFRNVVVA